MKTTTQHTVDNRKHIHRSEKDAAAPGFNIYDQPPDYYDATLSPEYIEECFMPIQRLIDSLRKPEGVSILDLCCGTGVVPDLIRDLEGVSYLGLDLNPTFLDRARERKAGNEHFTFVEADLLKHQFDRRFDIVMMINGYHHFENHLKSQVLKKVHGLLAPEGSFILYEMCISAHGNHDEFVRMVLDFYDKRIEWTRKNEPMTPKKLEAWENVRDLSVAGGDEYKVDHGYILKDFHANGFALKQETRVWPPENEDLFDDSRVGDFLFLFDKDASKI